MKLISLKEFFQNNQKENKDISLYLDYLSKHKSEVNESLEDAINLGLSEKLVDDLQSQIHFIDELELIIENSFEELVIPTIDNMSDKELNEIGLNYLSQYYKEQQELQISLDEKLEAKRKDEEKEKEMFIANGYKDSYYEAYDTDVFFVDIKSPNEYIKDLIKSDRDKDNLSTLFSLIYPEYSDELADMIIKLRKIVSIADSEETLDEVASSFVSSNGMGKIVRLIIDEDCQKMIIFLQEKVKYNTEFFKNLPEDLRESIENNGFIENGVYGCLHNIYNDYMENGTVTMPESSVKEYDEEIKNLEEKISSLEKQIADLRLILSDVDKLREFIKKQVAKTSDANSLSFGVLEKYLKERQVTEGNLNDKLEDLNARKDKYAPLVEKISKILDDENNRDFEIVHARNALRLMDLLGSDATEEAIYPIVEAENRRLKQFEIIREAIKYLNEIKSSIETIDNDRNIIHNLNGANKREREKLILKYQDTCKEYYEKLYKADLLRIVVSHSYLDKESETLDKPASFEKMFNGGNTPLYEVTPENYQEFVLRGVISSNVSIDELNYFFKASYALAHELFSAHEINDHMLEFKLDNVEIEQAIDAQKRICHIYTKLYDSRKEERSNFSSLANCSISDEMNDLIKELGINEASITREELEKRRLELEEAITQCDEELELNQINLSELKNIADEVSIEDAKAYYEMLSGFYESIIANEEIQKRI